MWQFTQNDKERIIYTVNLLGIFGNFTAQKRGGYTRVQPANASGPANANGWGAGIYVSEAMQPLRLSGTRSSQWEN